MTERIASPLLGSTFVCVQRSVLLEILDRAWLWSEGEFPEEHVAQVFRLRNEVESGTLDHIDAAIWRGGRGEETT